MIESLSYDMRTENISNKDILKTIKLPKYNANTDRNCNIMWNQLFYTENEIGNAQLTSTERETDKERELTVLKKIFNYKLNRKYLTKLSDLLQQKHDSQYSLKRKYINETVYNFDENNNMYLTLPKGFKNRKMGKNNTKTEESMKTAFQRQETRRDIMKTRRQDIQMMIPEFFPKESDNDDDDVKNEVHNEEGVKPKNEESLDSDESSEWSEKGKQIWFEKWRTKNKFYDCNASNSNNILFPNETNKNYNINDQLYLTSNPYVSKSTEPIKNLKGRMHYKRLNEKELFIGKLNVFGDVKKMSEKNRIIKKSKIIESKIMLPVADLFHCDKKQFEKFQEKWNKSDKVKAKIKKKTALHVVKTEKRAKVEDSKDEFKILKSGTAAIWNNMKVNAQNWVSESNECEKIKEDLLKKDFQAITYKVQKKSRLNVNVIYNNNKSSAYRKSHTLLPFLKAKNKAKTQAM